MPQIKVSRKPFSYQIALAYLTARVRTMKKIIREQNKELELLREEKKLTEENMIMVTQRLNRMHDMLSKNTER